MARSQDSAGREVKRPPPAARSRGSCRRAATAACDAVSPPARLTAPLPSPCRPAAAAQATAPAGRRGRTGPATGLPQQDGAALRPLLFGGSALPRGRRAGWQQRGRCLRRQQQRRSMAPRISQRSGEESTTTLLLLPPCACHAVARLCPLASGCTCCRPVLSAHCSTHRPRPAGGRQQQPRVAAAALARAVAGRA